MAARFDLFSGKNKNNNSNEPIQQEVKTKTEKFYNQFVIAENISYFIIEEIENQNLDIKYEKLSNGYRFTVCEDDYNIFEKINNECEKKAKDATLKSKIEHGHDAVGNRAITQKQPATMTADVSNEIKIIFEELLKKSNVQHKFTPNNNDWLLQFLETDVKKIEQLVTEAYTIYTSNKTKEAIKTKDEEHKNKMKMTASTSPKYDVTEEEPVKKRATGRKRNNQIKVWVDDEEKKKISENAELVGKTQSEYMREMSVNGYIKKQPSAPNDVYLLKRIEHLESVLGKTSGALVKIMQSTKESGTLTEAERKDLNILKNELRKTQSEIRKEVKEIWH